MQDSLLGILHTWHPTQTIGFSITIFCKLSSCVIASQFEYSAKHGLQKGQFDMTWMVIKFLKTFGLATNVKLP